MKGPRINSDPVIVSDDEVKALRRMVLTTRHFDEGWIQELIRKSPNILPVEEIAPVFWPLASIGREVPTNAGPIDNLFISPSGYLTLVETKLWRNPEARREVVGQIIDYAKELTRWSFSDLDQRVRTYNQKYENTNMGVIDSLRTMESIDDFEEAALVDTITRNMRQGNFLLLIVGDGIRESVEELADFMQSFTNLHFALALVEL